MSTRGLLWLGGALLVLGWALIFLVVIRVLPESFLLAFVATVLLVLGSGVGFYGIFRAYRANRND